jgi:sulfate adenylyltransferase subunit 1
LIDARKGILDQSRRHALISSLLGIKHFVVAINKMDLVDYSKSIYDQIVADFKQLTQKLGLDQSQIAYIPISALNGDNVVNQSEIMTWYKGPTVIDVLETVDVQSDLENKKFRLPVQYVITADNNDFRGFAGQVRSGSIKAGDAVISLPSAKVSKVAYISEFNGKKTEARPHESITLVLEDQIDTSRGDMIVKQGQEPIIAKNLIANICWMSESNFDSSKKYMLKHCSNMVRAIPSKINYRLDVNTYEKLEASDLKLNDIASVEFKLQKPVLADLYNDNKDTGSFILIDELSNATVAAGMITDLN